MNFNEYIKGYKKYYFLIDILAFSFQKHKIINKSKCKFGYVKLYY